MTSTNDGKEVKSNQTSAPKGKTYYIELYKSLEAGLSSDCELRQRTQQVCEAWRRIHSLCQHSAPSTHPHLLSWLQKHTARTVLQTEWQSPNSKDDHKHLEEAINGFIKECENDLGGSREGGPPPWAVQLVARGEWFKRILANPWGHPVLRVLLDPRGEPPSDEEVLEWLKEERGVMFVTRLRQLAASKCNDLALTLASAVMDRVRACSEPISDLDPPADVKDAPKPDKKASFEDILKAEAGFTVDVWELLTDIEFVLLDKRDKRSRCIELAKQTPLRNGYQLVERLQSRLETSPREKKLWKNAKEVATLIAQVVIARCMVVPICSGASRTALYCCARSLVRALGPRLPAAARALAAPAATARHLHTLAAAVDAQSTEDMKPFVCELYVRAITAGMNELERLKLKTEKESEARSTEQTLSSWFTQLGTLLSASERIRCECTLTAFSVHPTPAMYDKIKAAPNLPPLAMDLNEPKNEQTNSEFGSWASDSRSQTNFVKTSETVNLKHTQHQANVLSTAIFSEGEALGLSPELCQDIAVLLSGPRLKTLSWDMDRGLLLENCRTYMERTNYGTRALTTELKYLNLDMKEYEHLPVEEDDENDIYYGIEKGYEHMVEEYQEPEEIWQDAVDPERTMSAAGSDNETEVIRVKKNKKSRKILSSDDDSDPLSLVAEAKRVEKKKERPHSKERSKETSKERKEAKPKGRQPKDKDKDKEKDPLTVKLTKEKKEKDVKKKEKKERKEKKRKDKPEKPSSLSSLVGMKVTKVNGNQESVIAAPDSSHRKLSVNSSTSNETDVLYDGLYSMDEIKFPEISPEALVESIKNDYRAVSNIDNKIKDSSSRMVPFNTKAESFLCQGPITTVTEDVKKSISKLIQFRRQKNASENESKVRPNVIHTSSNNNNKNHPPMSPQISPRQQSMDSPKINTNTSQSDQIADIKNEMNNLLCSKAFGIARPVIQYTSSNTNPLNNFQSPSNRLTNPQDIRKTQNPIPKVTNTEVSFTSARQDGDCQKSFHKFLKELQESINAGAGADKSKKKEIKPTNRVTPVIPSVKADPKTPCAKQTQKKTDLLNTFSRLSYLHKNKMEGKTKHVVDALIEYQSKTLQTPPSETEIDRITAEQKNAAKYFIQDSSAARVDQPYQRNNHNSLKNYDKSSPKNIEKPKSMMVKENPIISNILLQSSSTVTGKADSYKHIQMDQSREQMQTPSKLSSLTESDQQDLLLLLRQQSKQNLNHPRQRVEVVKNPNISQSPQTITSVPKYSVPYSSSQNKTSSTVHNYTNYTVKPNPSPKPSNLSQFDVRMQQTKPLNMTMSKTETTCTKPVDQVNMSELYRQASNKQNLSTPKQANQPIHPTGKSPDWIKVMDAILAHKTPSRGPNALDMALNKDVYNTSLAESLQNQKIVRTTSSGDTIEISSVPKQAKSLNVDLPKAPHTSLSKVPNTDLSKTHNIGPKASNVDISKIPNIGLSKTPKVDQSKNGPGILRRANTDTVIKTNKNKIASILQGACNIQKPAPILQGVCNTQKPAAILQGAGNTQKSASILQGACNTQKPAPILQGTGNTQNSASILQGACNNQKPTPILPGACNTQKATPVLQGTSNIRKLAPILQGTSHPQKLIPQLAPTVLQANPNITRPVQSDTPKRQIQQDKRPTQVLKEIDTKKLPNKCSDKQFTCPLPTQNDPFISGIPNSDYDLIDELMDDELRQEIGELSSDEEVYGKPVQNDPRSCSKKSASRSTQQCAQNTEKLINSTVVNQIQKKPVLNPTNNPNIVMTPTAFSNVKTVITTEYPKTATPVVQQTKIVHQMPKTVPQKPSEQNNINSNILRTVEQTYVAPIQTVPQQTTLQNVVLIGPEIVYQPCTVRTPVVTPVAPQNTYVTFNQSNMAIYQTTQFAAPVVNPLIIGNAMTVPAVTIPVNNPVSTPAGPKLETSKVIETPICNNQPKVKTEPVISKTVNINAKEKVEVKTNPTNEFTNDDVLKMEKEKFDLANKNSERKVLSEVQEKQKLAFNEKLDSKNGKSQSKLAFDCDIKKETPKDPERMKKDQERLKKKRFAILNRKISHRSDIKPIPLTYEPIKVIAKDAKLNKKEQNVDNQVNSEKTIPKLKIQLNPKGRNIVETVEPKVDVSENCKENKDNVSCRRILLRSSNKLAKTSTEEVKEIPLKRKTRVRLKRSTNEDVDKEPESITKSEESNDTTQENSSDDAKSNKEKSLKRHSARILNRAAKKVVVAKKIGKIKSKKDNTKSESKKSKKSKESTVTTEVPTALPEMELEDLESQISVTKIPKMILKRNSVSDDVSDTGVSDYISTEEGSSSPTILDSENNSNDVVIPESIQTPKLDSKEIGATENTVNDTDIINEIESYVKKLQGEKLNKTTNKSDDSLEKTCNEMFSDKPLSKTELQPKETYLLEPSEITSSKNKTSIEAMEADLPVIPGVKITIKSVSKDKVIKVPVDLPKDITVTSKGNTEAAKNVFKSKLQSPKNKIQVGAPKDSVISSKKLNKTKIKTVGNIPVKIPEGITLKMNKKQLQTKVPIKIKLPADSVTNKTSISNKDTILNKEGTTVSKCKITGSSLLPEASKGNENLSKTSQPIVAKLPLQTTKDIEICTKKVANADMKNKETDLPIAFEPVIKIPSKPEVEIYKNKLDILSKEVSIQNVSQNEVLPLNSKNSKLTLDIPKIMQPITKPTHSPGISKISPKISEEVICLDDDDEEEPKTNKGHDKKINDSDNIDEIKDADKNKYDKEGDIPMSLFKDIIVEDLPLPRDAAPNTKYVRIKLPSGRIYKATVHGQMKTNTETLFKDPGLRSILMSNICKRQRYTLNIRQVSKSEAPKQEGPAIVKDPRIQEITLFGNKETIDLVSDDEEENSFQFFATEFGNFRVKSMKRTLFGSHQRTFDKKCTVRLIKDDEAQKYLERQKQKEAVETLNTNLEETIQNDETSEFCSSPDVEIVEPQFTQPIQGPVHGPVNANQDSVLVLPIEKPVTSITVPAAEVVKQPDPQKMAIAPVEEIILPDAIIPVIPIASTEPDIIEITDDSDLEIDTAKKIENPPTAKVQESYLKINENNILLNDVSDKIDEFKNLLFKDLGIEDLAENSRQSADIPLTSNNSHIETDIETLSSNVSLPQVAQSECFIKLTKCDELVQKYEKLKLLKKCFVQLVRCDENQENTENDLKGITIDVADPRNDLKELNELIPLSRSGSFSILDNCDLFENPPSDFAMQLNGPSSPVIEAYDTIASTIRRLNAQEICNKQAMTCDSEWFTTKNKFRLLSKDSTGLSCEEDYPFDPIPIRASSPLVDRSRSRTPSLSETDVSIDSLQTDATNIYDKDELTDLDQSAIIVSTDIQNEVSSSYEKDQSTISQNKVPSLLALTIRMFGNSQSSNQIEKCEWNDNIQIATSLCENDESNDSIIIDISSLCEKTNLIENTETTAVDMFYSPDEYMNHEETNALDLTETEESTVLTQVEPLSQDEQDEATDLPCSVSNSTECKISSTVEAVESIVEKDNLVVQISENDTSIEPIEIDVQSTCQEEYKIKPIQIDDPSQEDELVEAIQFDAPSLSQNDEPEEFVQIDAPSLSQKEESEETVQTEAPSPCQDVEPVGPVKIDVPSPNQDEKAVEFVQIDVLTPSQNNQLVESVQIDVLNPSQDHKPVESAQMNVPSTSQDDLLVESIQIDVPSPNQDDEHVESVQIDALNSSEDDEHVESDKFDAPTQEHKSVKPAQVDAPIPSEDDKPIESNQIDVSRQEEEPVESIQIGAPGSCQDNKSIETAQTLDTLCQNHDSIDYVQIDAASNKKDSVEPSAGDISEIDDLGNQQQNSINVNEDNVSETESSIDSNLDSPTLFENDNVTNDKITVTGSCEKQSVQVPSLAKLVSKFLENNPIKTTVSANLDTIRDIRNITQSLKRKSLDVTEMASKVSKVCENSCETIQESLSEETTAPSEQLCENGSTNKIRIKSNDENEVVDMQDGEKIQAETKTVIQEEETVVTDEVVETELKLDSENFDDTTSSPQPSPVQSESGDATESEILQETDSMQAVMNGDTENICVLNRIIDEKIEAGIPIATESEENNETFLEESVTPDLEIETVVLNTTDNNTNGINTTESSDTLNNNRVEISVVTVSTSEEIEITAESKENCDEETSTLTDSSMMDVRKTDIVTRVPEDIEKTVECASIDLTGEDEFEVEVEVSRNYSDVEELSEDSCDPEESTVKQAEDITNVDVMESLYKENNKQATTDSEGYKDSYLMPVPNTNAELHQKNTANAFTENKEANVEIDMTMESKENKQEENHTKLNNKFAIEVDITPNNVNILDHVYSQLITKQSKEHIEIENEEKYSEYAYNVSDDKLTSNAIVVIESSSSDDEIIEDVVDMRSDEIVDSEFIENMLPKSIPSENKNIPQHIIEAPNNTSKKSVVFNTEEDESNNNDGIDMGNVLLNGIEFEDEKMGTCFLFHIETDDTVSTTSTQQPEEVEEIEEIDLKVIIPKYNYSMKYVSELKYDLRDKKRKSLKRKSDSGDARIHERKYRKGKNIDYPKITAATMEESAYRKEFKRLLEYWSTVKFSYSRPFHKEFIDVPEILKSWPLRGVRVVKEYENEPDDETDELFTDLEIDNRTYRDPSKQTLAEEIVAEYDESEYIPCDIMETNFNTGFGEGSDRVIQNLDDGCGSKFSAATLSDVKQTQPLLLSENYGYCKRVHNYDNFLNNDEKEKMRRNIKCIEMKKVVRSFFEKTMKDLSYNYLKQNKITKTLSSYGLFTSEFPFGLTNSDFFEPAPLVATVQVVQVGQLPVSAAAQNPMTCDPRVTQVSEASPSQCSAENSPNDDPQSTIKTEYTELTTADLNMPLTQQYVQHIQAMPILGPDTITNYSMVNEHYLIDKPEIKMEDDRSEVKEEMNDNYDLNGPQPFAVDYDYDAHNGHISAQNNCHLDMMYRYTEQQPSPEAFPQHQQLDLQQQFQQPHPLHHFQQQQLQLEQHLQQQQQQQLTEQQQRQLELEELRAKEKEDLEQQLIQQQIEIEQQRLDESLRLQREQERLQEEKRQEQHRLEQERLRVEQEKIEQDRIRQEQEKLQLEMQERQKAQLAAQEEQQRLQQEQQRLQIERQNQLQKVKKEQQRLQQEIVQEQQQNSQQESKPNQEKKPKPKSKKKKAPPKRAPQEEPTAQQESVTPQPSTSQQESAPQASTSQQETSIQEVQTKPLKKRDRTRSKKKQEEQPQPNQNEAQPSQSNQKQEKPLTKKQQQKILQQQQRAEQQRLKQLQQQQQKEEQQKQKQLKLLQQQQQKQLQLQQKQLQQQQRQQQLLQQKQQSQQRKQQQQKLKRQQQRQQKLLEQQQQLQQQQQQQQQLQQQQQQQQHKQQQQQQHKQQQQQQHKQQQQQQHKQQQQQQHKQQQQQQQLQQSQQQQPLQQPQQQKLQQQPQQQQLQQQSQQQPLQPQLILQQQQPSVQQQSQQQPQLQQLLQKPLQLQQQQQVQQPQPHSQLQQQLLNQQQQHQQQQQLQLQQQQHQHQQQQQQIQQQHQIQQQQLQQQQQVQQQLPQKQVQQPDPQPSHQQSNAQEKSDQLANAMNAAGISSNAESSNNRTQGLINMLNQKLRQQNTTTTGQTTANNFPKTTAINAMALQQALAQILPPPLNQTNNTEKNQPASSSPQVLHIVQGKNASGNQQITLVDNQQSVINTPNNAPVLHIVQNKSTPPGPASNGAPATQTSSFSGLSLVEGGLQQGNQVLHIVNAGNQKNAATGQLLKRVNLLTNLTNVQGGNEQKMVQFVCKSADGKPIQLNGPHQRNMVLRLQPIETPNLQPTQAKQNEVQEPSLTPNTPNSSSNKESPNEIKSRSVYEENYAKFIQGSSHKTIVPEKGTSLPKFNQAFGKQGYQDGQKNEIANNSTHLTSNGEGPDCLANDNAVNLDHITQMNSPPLLLRKSSPPSQSQSNLVQQLKQTMNIQGMPSGVIYTRQIPVNIGGGQTINLISVPSSDISDENAKQHGDVKFVNQGDMEPSIIKIVPQTQNNATAEGANEENNNNQANGTTENGHPPPQPPPVLTQMRIKLPMLSKAPQVVSGARVVRPSFFQIQRNVIGGANQPVYQQLVLTAAPPPQQTVRLPQAQASKPAKTPSESQSSTESLSSSTLEQLREFDLVFEQVKERSTVQPNAGVSSSGAFSKLHAPSTDSTDSPAPSRPTQVNTSPTQAAQHTQHQVLYSIGNTQPLSVTYVNKKVVTPTATTSFVRSPDSSGIIDSPSSSSHSHIPHSVTSEASTSDPTPSSSTTPPKKSSSKSKSKPKTSTNPPNTLKLNSVPPKTSSQKPLEDEQTTQRILYILAEYKEQVENSPDKDKPAPRRRTNPPCNPGSSKRKKSSSGCRRRDMSPCHGEDTCRTLGSEDSSCGTSQGDCTESCLDSHSPQESPRKVVRKLTFEHETTPTPQPRPQPQRNVIVADGQTITVARGTAGKPATAVLMPANYILPVSMVKGGQQIAIVTNRGGPKLLTVGGGEGGTTNALLLQRLIGPGGLKPVLARPGVRHVRLPTAALHNLQAFNLASATSTSTQLADSTASPAPAPTPPELIDTRANSSPWRDRSETREANKPEQDSSPEEEPWHLPPDYGYEEIVRTAETIDRTVLDPIPDRYSPDMEAQRIFDKMFDVDSKKSYMVGSDDSPRCGYDIDASDCDDKAYHQVVQKKDGTHHRQRLTHVHSVGAKNKFVLDQEMRFQKSLSEECEDLGVDSPSASELFPEAELLFAASPAHDHNTQEHGHHSHTPQPTLTANGISQPDLDDQIATDQLIQRQDIHDDRSDLGIGLEDVGIVTVSEDGMQATIALDQEEFARSHPNTTFHSEPTDDGMVQPFTITGLKGRTITQTIFHANRAPGTVLMTAPQTTVISQATAESSGVQNTVKYSDIDNMINSLPTAHSHSNNINLSSVLVKDDGLTRFDNILHDNRELHLSHTASAIVHATGNTTQVIRRVCYENRRETHTRFLMDEGMIASDNAKMMPDDSRDFDDERSTPERTELFWESNSASERSEGRRHVDFSSDSDKCCKSPFDENNSTDSSGVGTHMRLHSVIKEARGVERSGSGDGSSADDCHPPLRTYPPKRMYTHHGLDRELDRNMTGGKTRAGERSPDNVEIRRRASVRGVVKRGCHCCNGSPVPPRPKKPRQKKPHLDFTTTH